jgi:hypothetical protein
MDLESSSARLVCEPAAIPEAERQAHFTLARSLFRDAALEKKWGPDGYTVTFAAGERERLERFVSNERKCCSFLDFQLKAGRTGEPLLLLINGPAAAREIIEMQFSFKGGSDVQNA